MTNRDALIDVLWAKASDVLYITREQFVEALTGWEISPIEAAGELAYLTLQKGPEFHCHSLGAKRSIPGKQLSAFIQKVIDENGYAATRTPKTDLRQQKFNRYFGFEVIGEDEFDVHYRIEKLRHVRREEMSTCPQ